MSAITPIIKLAKQVKRQCKNLLVGQKEVLLSPVRRLENVKTERRICAMTFDDGPCGLPPKPSDSDVSLTARLLDTLKEYDSKGTFDVIGDTGGNYPDVAGKLASPSWGGIRYDHYPDIAQDSFGGVVACPDLVKRIIAEGHELTNHGYAHILFGKKPLVYGKRVYLENLDKVLEDLRKLHQYMESEYDYTMKLSRPPHYVDKIAGGFSSYDAYQQMGYQYMAASFDGAGWLPCKSYEEEVRACYEPMEQKLQENPDYFCGQIIFQKDGYNMAKRSPVVDGLPKQLELLKRHDYEVVTVSELLSHSSFSDVGLEESSAVSALRLLEHDKCLVYRDNQLRLYNLLTYEELAMVFFGIPQELHRIALVKNPRVKPMFSDVPPQHPYRGAIEYAVAQGYLQGVGKKFQGKRPVSGKVFNEFCEKFYGSHCDVNGDSLTHRAMIKALNHLEQ